ncbi:MAG: CsbD family protein [Hymenobacteraceae bacterium]|nr:CsbD family protein [Hymenobacteraceae bacterium]
MANYQNLENYGDYPGKADYDHRHDADYYGPDYDADDDSSSSSNTGKVLLAALLGAATGAVVGLLLAPDKGVNTVASLRGSAGQYSEQLQSALKKYLDKLEAMGLTGAGSRLQLKGNWNDLKGQLKQQYGDLTDEDLTYAEGAGDELVGNVQRRLGKTKREVVELLNNLG